MLERLNKNMNKNDCLCEKPNKIILIKKIIYKFSTYFNVWQNVCGLFDY